MVMTGKVLLVCALAGAAVAALISGRLGWKNYWGGFVYAPFALGIAVLLVVATLRRRERSSRRQSLKR
jgi:membrane protein implicated in regulation of membrane protease activity